MSGIFSNNLITKDEVKVLIGLDLDNLQPDDNPSNSSERLIYQAQSVLYSYIKMNYGNDMLLWYHNRLNNEQRNHVKMAIAYQVKYIFFNGDMSIDSLAYNNSASIIKNNARMVCPNSIMELSFCGNLVRAKVQKTNMLGQFMETELFGR